MFTLARSIRMGFLAPIIVLALIGALASCRNPAADLGPSNSISKGSESALHTSLQTDARNLVIGLTAFNAETGKYPPAANFDQLDDLVSAPLNHGNYVADYGLSADGLAFTLTLTNDTITGDKSIQYSSNTGLYR